MVLAQADGGEPLRAVLTLVLPNGIVSLSHEVFVEFGASQRQCTASRADTVALARVLLHV